MSQTPPKPWLLELRSSEAFIVLVITIALFTDVFIYGMIIPIIPAALVERVGIPPQDAQTWISILLAVYGGTLMIGSPIFGYFADRSSSSKSPFVVGLFALAISTACFMLSTSLAGFLIARIMQSLSATAVWVAGLALVTDTVDESRVAEVMGYTSAGMTGGMLLGPALGGIMFEKLGFSAAFYLPIALIAVDIVLRFAMIEPKVARQWKQGLSDDTAQPERSDEYSPLLSPAPIADDKTPQIFRLLGQRRLLVALLVTFVCAATLSAFETTLPIFVAETFHWGTSGAGLIFLAMCVPSLSGALVGMIVDKYGGRILSTIAFAFATTVLILLRFVQHAVPSEHALLIILLVIMDLSFTAASLASMTEIFEVVNSSDATQASVAKGRVNPVAQGYALLNMAFAGGQLLGPILGGFIKVHAGWKVMTLVLGLMSAVATIVVAFFMGERPTKNKDPEPEGEISA